LRDADGTSIETASGFGTRIRSLVFVRIRQYAEFFGSPKAGVIALHRRSKKWRADVDDLYRWAS
jgi:hypothetical protein